MSFPVFLDTCVLYPATLTDTLLRIAEQGVIRPYWSRDVLQELHRNLAQRIGEDRAVRRIQAMETAFNEAAVSGYEDLIDSMTCDPKDRHVLAAAVASGSQVIVTFNLKDFPVEALSGHDIDAVNPDDFLLDQLDLYPGAVMAALAAQISATTRPHLTPLMLLDALGRCGVPRFVAELRRKTDLSAWGRADERPRGG